MLEKKFTAILNQAGVTVNGHNPWDIRVRSSMVYWSLIFGNLFLGESYMRQEWNCERLDEFFHRLVKAKADKRKYITDFFAFITPLLANAQKRNPWRIAEKHYNLGNDLFAAMLDGNMQYTCAYPNSGDSLELAQIRKLDLICKKLQLKPGDSVLDIGCGWGGLAHYAAAKYGVNVTGLTISREQAKLARQKCDGLPIAIVIADYREFLSENKKFNKIASVGMFEHVGPKNYRTFMQLVARCLKDDGLFLLHTIVSKKVSGGSDPWVDKYIFPDGYLPSLNQILSSVNGLFKKLDDHEFGSLYAWTLMQWWQKFDSAWPELSKDQKYDKRFYRMWEYYLKSFAGAFRARELQLWQIVFSKKEAESFKYATVR